MPALLTIRDAAEHLGVSTNTLRRMTVTGELPAVRMSRRVVRVRRVDVESLAGRVGVDVSPRGGTQPSTQPPTESTKENS